MWVNILLGVLSFTLPPLKKQNSVRNRAIMWRNFLARSRIISVVHLLDDVWLQPYSAYTLLNYRQHKANGHKSARGCSVDDLMWFWQQYASTTNNSISYKNQNQNPYIFIEDNAFENVVWKMAAILSQSQQVKVAGQRAASMLQWVSALSMSIF